MPLKVTFEISEQDLKHFRKEMKRAHNAVRIGDDEDIIAGAQATMNEIARIDVPHFVKERVEKLAAMSGPYREKSAPKFSRPSPISAIRTI